MVSSTSSNTSSTKAYKTPSSMTEETLPLNEEEDLEEEYEEDEDYEDDDEDQEEGEFDEEEEEEEDYEDDFMTPCIVENIFDTDSLVESIDRVEAQLARQTQALEKLCKVLFKVITKN